MILSRHKWHRHTSSLIAFLSREMRVQRKQQSRPSKSENVVLRPSTGRENILSGLCALD